MIARFAGKRADEAQPVTFGFEYFWQDEGHALAQEWSTPYLWIKGDLE